jgi:hypothetical protein
MSSVEYVFADHVVHAEALARGQGWRPYGRAQWRKRDGTVVYFLSLVVQLEIVSPGETVHVIGHASEPLRVLKRKKAVAVCHEPARAD